MEKIDLAKKLSNSYWLVIIRENNATMQNFNMIGDICLKLTETLTVKMKKIIRVNLKVRNLLTSITPEKTEFKESCN